MMNTLNFTNTRWKSSSNMVSNNIDTAPNHPSRRSSITTTSTTTNISPFTAANAVALADYFEKTITTTTTSVPEAMVVSDSNTSSEGSDSGCSDSGCCEDDKAVMKYGYGDASPDTVMTKKKTCCAALPKRLSSTTTTSSRRNSNSSTTTTTTNTIRHRRRSSILRQQKQKQPLGVTLSLSTSDPQITNLTRALAPSASSRLLRSSMKGSCPLRGAARAAARLRRRASIATLPAYHTTNTTSTRSTTTIDEEEEEEELNDTSSTLQQSLSSSITFNEEVELRVFTIKKRKHSNRR